MDGPKPICILVVLSRLSGLKKKKRAHEFGKEKSQSGEIGEKFERRDKGVDLIKICYMHVPDSQTIKMGSRILESYA